MTETREAVISTFQRISEDAPPDLEDRLDEKYLEKGFIDSLDLVSFITDLESQFDIQFTAQEFESEEFETLAGVVELIEEKK